MVFCCKITIGEYVFHGVHSLEIKSTWKMFTQTAKILLPKKMYYEKDSRYFPVTQIKDIFKRGDRVRIELGYNNSLDTRFEGYLSRSPRPTIPYELECEDEMWILKQKEVSVNRMSATVKQILQEAAPSYEIICPDEIYGDFSLLQTTPVKIFDELRKKAGLYTFFRGNRLVCGLPYADPNMTETIPNLVFGNNIIESTLQYRDMEDCRVKIYGSSVQNNGTVIRVEAGENGGDIVRENYGTQLTKEELEIKVKRILETYKTRGGYSGDIRTFGWPVVQHGQKVHILDTGIYEKRDSINYVEEVVIRVSASEGFKQTLVIGKSAV
ncbi:hypothetical protein Ga0061079_11722 [Apibacter mensalis]|uniref:Phage protein D n=2 Tax=Apibacter mensalis TaxID=1586267 RepID=A0A0X3AS40_9FLAO|nr:hypothetical protein Ga0061079_11722 [Apibacter mensalis]